MCVEHDQPGYDGLQAGLHPVQVVGAAEQGGELHPLNPAQTVHKLPQTGEPTSEVNSEFYPMTHWASTQLYWLLSSCSAGWTAGSG